MTRPDVLIVGGGVMGCAVAYQLAREGLRVSVLERDGLCAGASGANAALIWPQAMARSISLDLTLQCARMFPTLGEELGADIEYRRTGGMVAIETDEQWAQMADYVAGQAEVGLHAELLDVAEARRREPLLAPDLLGAVFAVASAITGALAATQTRSLTRLEPAATIVVYFSTLTAVFSLVTAPFGWAVPSPVDMLYLVGAGICGGVGQVLLTQSYRFGDASLIAPFDYASMLWALIASLAIFGTWPSATVLAGAAIVIAAGLFVIYREHRLGIQRTRSKRAQTPTTPLS